MAVAKFRSKIFTDPVALAAFVQADANVSSVVSVVTDGNGSYVLFYLIP